MLLTALLLEGVLFAHCLPVKRGAEEIQHAICRITTKELVATANATITRQLKGVCTSDEFQRRIELLEMNLTQKLEELKEMFKTGDTLIDPQKVQYKSFEDKNVKSEDHNFEISNVESSTFSRLEEIMTYNDTVIETNQENIYMYYWTIENINKILSMSDLYKSSPNFEVLGHTLQLRLYPNYPEINYFTVQLKPLSKGFIKKHRILILNQHDTNADLNSGILFGLTNNETMFQLNVKNIRNEGYIENEAAICALKIYLDS